jgi:nucleotide-binding universal stress UspA family protein
VRRFNALVLGDNANALGLVKSAGGAPQQYDTGVVELVIELPAERGMGAQLVRALRAAAAGDLRPAYALAERVAVGVESSSPAPVPAARPIRTIVAGADGTETGGKAVGMALRLAADLGARLHVVSAYGGLQAPADADAVLAAATRAARAEGLEAVTHARRDDATEALLAVAEEQDADLLVVGSSGTSRASWFLSDSVPSKLSQHGPCSVLIVRSD